MLTVMKWGRLVCVATLSLCLGGCSQYYLSVGQQWIDARYLASTHVKTPDPRQANPPIGQMLVIDWRVPKEVIAQHPRVVLDLILWDYTTKQVTFPMKRRMDYAVFQLLNEEYETSGGILTYQAKIITEDEWVYREWKHQLFVNLITVD